MNHRLALWHIARVSALAEVVDGSGLRQLGPGWWEPALLRAERSGVRRTRPDWVDTVENAIAARVHADLSSSAESWQQAFAVPFGPFLATVRDHIAAVAARCLSSDHAEPDLIAGTYAATLGPRLARAAARVLACELAAARTSNSLEGPDGRRRFADFLGRLSAPAGLAALCERYPVLARLLGTASTQAMQAGAELLERFAADRSAMIDALLDGVDPGPIVAIKPGLGDRHRGGRSVSAVSFADGRNVIYKPRDIQALAWFGDAVGWLNQRVPDCGLRAACAMTRAGYGWLEYVTPRPLAQPGDAARFYRRLGALLAVLYATQATDVHFENLIADADQPVLIDAETLFHPTLPTAIVPADPAAAMLAASVFRTALLPSAFAGPAGVVDQSGMGGDMGQICSDLELDWDPPATDEARLVWRPTAFTGAANRPCCDGEAIEPADHEAVLLEGFRLGYDAIARDRRAFGRLSESCADIEVRIIVRPTRTYARLLDESTQPDLLRDATARQKALGAALRTAAQQPHSAQLARHELADLWAGDIPLLTSRPGRSHIWTSAGRRLAGMLGQTGLDCALEKIEAMGEADRLEQEWVISASLATRRPGGDHRSSLPVPDPVTPVAAEPARLLAAACGLADQIVARATTSGEQTGRGRVNWLGLQLVDDTRWMVLPMGADLAEGYLGVALFLAQLASLTGIGRYVDQARRAVSPLPQLLGALDGRADLLAAIGCGGTRGLGGICYGLARIGTLLHDSELRSWTRAAVQVAASAAELSVARGWAAGSAGCLAAMTAVRAETGSAAAAALARTCADQLTELVEHTDGRCAPKDDPVLPGFAAGPAGIGWALARFAAMEQDPRCALAGQRALRRAIARSGDERSDGWCSGKAGLLMARAALADDAEPAELSRALHELAGRPVLGDLSLCHGELGITEALSVLTASSRNEAAYEALRHRTGLVLAAVRRRARYCGTPGGVITPGLLRGLAGIGYGLLRLGFAEQVPSVLLLEPSSSSSSRNPPI